MKKKKQYVNANSAEANLKYLSLDRGGAVTGFTQLESAAVRFKEMNAAVTPKNPIDIYNWENAFQVSVRKPDTEAFWYRLMEIMVDSSKAVIGHPDHRIDLEVYGTITQK